VKRDNLRQIGPLEDCGMTDPMTKRRELLLRERIERGLEASHLELGDESARHAGHPGAASGAGHYRVVVVSERFAGLDPVARHRLVYAAVGDLIPHEVHALAITTHTPEEWARRARS
jgi:BolA protein